MSKPRTNDSNVSGFPFTDNSGFILDLIDGKSEYKSSLVKHLDNGWLDSRTRNLVVEFKTYTPNVDCITAFKIQFQTTTGLIYTVDSMVCTIKNIK